MSVFWGMVHKTLQRIVEYNIPMTSKTLYMCDLTEEETHARDRYLVEILQTANKKAITRNWCKMYQKQLMAIVEEIYVIS